MSDQASENSFKNIPSKYFKICNYVLFILGVKSKLRIKFDK